jgi:hypothetical protein
MRIAAVRWGWLAMVTSLLWPAASIGMGADGTPATLRSPVSHTLSARTAADESLTDWALGRFDEAGLTLPALAISFHDEKDSCGGFFGLYRHGTPGLIDICGFNWDRFLPMPKKVVLHELAHAWIARNLADDTRSAFLSLRGLDNWGDDRQPWDEQGSEQAAEIMAWGLMDEEFAILIHRDADAESLETAFELLTGRAPIAPGPMLREPAPPGLVAEAATPGR